MGQMGKNPQLCQLEMAETRKSCTCDIQRLCLQVGKNSEPAKNLTKNARNEKAIKGLINSSYIPGWLGNLRERTQWKIKVKQTYIVAEVWMCSLSHNRSGLRGEEPYKFGSFEHHLYPNHWLTSDLLKHRGDSQEDRLKNKNKNKNSQQQPHIMGETNYTV